MAFSQPPPDQAHPLDHIIDDLCKPIKDLRENFSINIREYLEKYMDEIHELVDIHGETMNFSQAAMMIQGSVGCYSKKVDYLLQHSMKTLNMIGKDKDDDFDLNGDNNPDNPGGGGLRRRRDDGQLGTGDFVPLEIQMDKNLQRERKKRERIQNIEELERKFKDNGGFIQVTPREFIEREGLEAPGSKVELFHGPNYDFLGYKKDFRLNSQFSMATATFGDRLYLEPADLDRGLDETLINENFVPDKYQGNGDDDGAEGSVFPEQEMEHVFEHSQSHPDHNGSMNEEVASADEVGCQNIEQNVDDGDHVGGGDDGWDNDVEPFEEMEVRALQNIKSRTRDCVALLEDIMSKDQNPDAMSDDPWKSEDLFEVNENRQPIRRAKVHRLPPRLRAKKSKSAKAKIDEEVPISRFISDSIVSYTSQEFPYLSHHIMKEQERRKQMMRIVAKTFKQGHDNPEDLAAAEKEVTTALLHHNNQQDDDVLPDQDRDFDDGGAPQNDDGFDDYEPLPDPHAGDNYPGGEGEEGHVDMIDMGSDKQSTLSQTREPSYEDLVAKMVGEYVQRSHAWMSSTEVVRKVQSWHAMIAPRLKVVESRVAFDIHSYGSDILDTFPKEDHDKHPVIHFGKVAKNKSKEEVSRYFLASLMLANCHNVEIKSQGEINDMHLQFLSSARHHEQLEEFQSASQQI